MGSSAMPNGLNTGSTAVLSMLYSSTCSLRTARSKGFSHRPSEQDTLLKEPGGKRAALRVVVREEVTQWARAVQRRQLCTEN